MAKGAAWVGAVDIFTTEVDDVTVDRLLIAAADEEPMGAVNPPTTDTANAKDTMESFILILQDYYYCNHRESARTSISILPPSRPGENYKVDMAKLQSQLQRNLLRSSYVQYVLGYLVTSISIVSQVRDSGTWLWKASELPPASLAHSQPFMGTLNIRCQKSTLL